MALTTYLVAKAHGVPFTAVPVFLVRGFHHGAIHRSPGVGHPRARRTSRAAGSGSAAATRSPPACGRARSCARSTASTSTRSPGCCPATSTSRSTARRPTSSPSAGADAGGDAARGELAAVDRRRRSKAPTSTPLIPDPRRRASRALRERGLYPINHLVVIRDERARGAARSLAAEVFDAFARAKQALRRPAARRRDRRTRRRPTGCTRGSWRPPAPTRCPTGSSPTGGTLERAAAARRRPAHPGPPDGHLEERLRRRPPVDLTA